MQLLIILTNATTSPAQAGPVVPWARIVIAFLFCIALAVGSILWLRARQGLPMPSGSIWNRLKRSGLPDEADALTIERRLRVTPTGQLLILRCDGRRYLVHVGPQQAQLLDRLVDATPFPETTR